jgi:SPP1 family predicted phage head-tail adaptor
MISGRMKRRITFQVAEDSRDGYGQIIHSWRDIGTVWAEIRAISGRELLASSTIYSEATVRIWVRYRDDITTANRILYDLPNIRGQVYSIIAVIPDADYSRLELLCKGGISND